MRHGSSPVSRQVILSDGSADSKIRSPLQTRQGESHLGCLKRPVDEFEILASPGFRKKTLVNNLDGQLPTSTAWCTFFTTINSVWLLLLLQLCRKSSPSCKKPIRNPQRHGTLRCSKATWSFAPALALLERAPWLLADRWGVRLGVKSRQTAFKQGSLNGTDHFWELANLMPMYSHFCGISDFRTFCGALFGVAIITMTPFKKQPFKWEILILDRSQDMV